MMNLEPGRLGRQGLDGFWHVWLVQQFFLRKLRRLASLLPLVPLQKTGEASVFLVVPTLELGDVLFAVCSEVRTERNRTG